MLTVSMLFGVRVRFKNKVTEKQSFTIRRARCTREQITGECRDKIRHTIFSWRYDEIVKGRSV